MYTRVPGTSSQLGVVVNDTVGGGGAFTTTCVSANAGAASTAARPAALPSALHRSVGPVRRPRRALDAGRRPSDPSPGPARRAPERPHRPAAVLDPYPARVRAAERRWLPGDHRRRPAPGALARVG